MEQLMSSLCSVDKNTWLIIGAVLVVFAVISFVKKIIKLGLFILILALGITYGGRVVSSMSEKLGITMNNGIISINDSYDIELNNVKSVVIKTTDNKDKVMLDIVTNSKTKTIEIPAKALWVLKPMLKKSNIGTIDMR